MEGRNTSDAMVEGPQGQGVNKRVSQSQIGRLFPRSSEDLKHDELIPDDVNAQFDWQIRFFEWSYSTQLTVKLGRHRSTYFPAFCIVVEELSCGLLFFW